MTPPLSRSIKVLLFLGLATFFQVALFMLLHNNYDRLPLSGYFPGKDKETEDQTPDPNRFHPHHDPSHAPEKAFKEKEEVVPVVALPEPSASAYSDIMKANVDRYVLHFSASPHFPPTTLRFFKRLTSSFLEWESSGRQATTDSLPHSSSTPSPPPTSGPANTLPLA